MHSVSQNLDVSNSLMSWKQRMWKVIVSQSFPTLFDPMDCSPQGSSVHEILQARILESVAISFSGGSSQLRNWTQVSFFAGGLFTIEPPEKPKNTGVGSLFLPQGIFPTPGNQTGVSCIAGRFFTSRTTRECLSTCLTVMCSSHVSL